MGSSVSYPKQDLEERFFVQPDPNLYALSCHVPGRYIVENTVTAIGKTQNHPVGIVFRFGSPPGRDM